MTCVAGAGERQRQPGAAGAGLSTTSTFVEVDANGGADTVNLGGVTQLAFPALTQTSVDVEDASADSVTGSEARDVVHADSLDDVSTGARRRLGGGGRQRQRRRGQRHAPRQISG